jgi:mono/diheme cytochrome c family protein
MLLRASSAVLLLAAGLAGCELGFPAGAEPHRDLNFLDMGTQPKLKPQRADFLLGKSTGMQAGPGGAIAINDEPAYPYAKEEADLAGAEVKNPLETTAANVVRGKWVYENVCITCHGPQGAGDGEVTKFFPKPPSLMTQRVRDFTDGRIFHNPMRGQNSMPSHEKVLAQKDMWAVVLYIRDLQKRLPVAPPPPPATTGTQPAVAPVAGANQK